MPGSWLNGWSPGDLITAAEFKKEWGCFYDHTTSGTDASLAITLPTWGAAIYFDVQLLGDSSSAFLWMRFNGSSSAIYDRQELYGSDAAAGASRLDSDTKFSVTGLAKSTDTAGSSTTGEIRIPNYRGTVFWKSAVTSFGVKRGTGAGSLLADIEQLSWRSTAALTTVTFLPDAGNFVTGSRVRGYVSG